jgi:ribonuclease VapC
VVIDTSAIIGILTNEEDAASLEMAIERDPVRLISAASVLETAIVIEARFGPPGGRELDLFLHATDVEVVPVNREQAELARVGWRAFGKGLDAAGLNFGDCFSYALAKFSGEPLLFTGDDFGRTDVQPAR